MSKRQTHGATESQPQLATTKPLLALLKDVVKLLLDGAVYFTGESARAKAARDRLRKKRDPDDQQFFANLHEDLRRALEVFSGIPDSWTDGLGPGQQAISALLDVVQERYIEHDESDDEHGDASDSDDSIDSGSQPAYPLLRRILVEYRSVTSAGQADSSSEEHRVAWYCSHIKLEKTSSKARSALSSALKQCHDVLKPLAGSAPVDTSWREPDQPSTLWTTEVFMNAEAFHKSVLSDWECDCFEDEGPCLHQNVSMSFDSLEHAKAESARGAMVYQTLQKDSTVVWKYARYQFEPGRKARDISAALCEALDGCSQDTLIKFDNGLPRIVTRQAGDQTGGNNALAEIQRDWPLTPCFSLGKEHSVFRLSEKKRMILALYLVYAYRDLGGGQWWPYHRKTSVLLPNVFDARALTVFFVPTLQHGNIADEFDYYYRYNRTMPSLVALGQLLLSLFLGRPVHIDDMKRELDGCAERSMATEIAKAVSACLNFTNLATTADASPSRDTIRLDDFLRARFEQDVILPFQYVLHYGYHVKAQDVFAPPETIKIQEAVTPRRKRSATPSTSIADVPDGYCLHDGHGVEKLEKAHADGADDYMAKLQECFAPFYKRHPSSHGTAKPVRVAVLDTGADIGADQLTHVYDDRVFDSRTWLTTQDLSGEALFGAQGEVRHALDSNGHGTHGTSVLLEATQGSNIKVYVAQVFRAAEEKVVAETGEAAAKRVADAIRYAVDVWNVDIISMSFGFQREVDVIEAAIEHAHARHKLMVCAASNCGANDRPSWPARDSRTLRIYASDGWGNKYLRNPDPISDEHNFSTLGCAVEAYWPSPGREAIKKRKSGTSTAAPIAAAVAAHVISIMRGRETSYAGAASSTRSAAELMAEHEKQLLKLGRPPGMSKVFQLMMGSRPARDGFKYITPWALFNSRTTDQALVDAILYDA